MNNLVSACVVARIAAASLFLGLALMSTAEACSVPVFRWALERWPADHYELLLFHEKPVPEADHAQLRALEQRVKDTNGAANLRVRNMDVTQPIDEPYVPTWREAQGGPLPRCFLMLPRGSHVSTPVWSGALNELPLETLLDSPARRELARRLLSGQSGVWLLLRSGDRAKDVVAAELLAKEIDRANKTLRLPDMTGDEVLEEAALPDTAHLRVEFSLLDVDRKDPAELMLVRMLLGSEPDLLDYREAMAFPVYGRGRVLYALVGPGINAGTIMKANAFLVGRCACEIKAENPGTDLLMPVDWEEGIGDNAAGVATELPPLPGTALPVPAVSPETTKGEADVAFRDGAAPFVRNAALVGAAAVLLVVTGTLVSLARRRGER